MAFFIYFYGLSLGAVKKLLITFASHHLCSHMLNKKFKCREYAVKNLLKSFVSKQNDLRVFENFLKSLISPFDAVVSLISVKQDKTRQDNIVQSNLYMIVLS